MGNDDNWLTVIKKYRDEIKQHLDRIEELHNAFLIEENKNKNDLQTGD